MAISCRMAILKDSRVVETSLAGLGLGTMACCLMVYPYVCNRVDLLSDKGLNKWPAFEPLWKRIDKLVDSRTAAKIRKTR